MSRRSLSDRHVYWLKLFFRLLAVGLGAVHAWQARHAISPDAISYLDMADVYLRRDWQMTVNGLWSPLYPSLLAFGMLVCQPSPDEEVAVAHLVNFIIYLGALAGFEFLLRGIDGGGGNNETAGEKRDETADEKNEHDEKECGGKQRDTKESDGKERGGKKHDGKERENSTLPVWAWTLLGYTLFISTSLKLTTLAAVTPDMAVAALIYLAAGLVLRLRRRPAKWRTFALLGVVLGLCYLAKAAMLPVALIVLAVALFSSTGSLNRKLPRILLALGLFTLVAGLYFVPLSIRKGRLTFGDSGRLNYAWYINGVTLHVHWQGDDASQGTPRHPTRKIGESPAVYEFRTPFRATYPPWYEPSYWYEGVTPRFAPAEQLRVLRKNLGTLSLILAAREQKIWWAGLLILYLLGCRRLREIDEAARNVWPLLLPALAAFAMFSLVHVEARYTGAFLLLMWLALLAGVRLRETPGWRKITAACIVVGLALVAWRGLWEPVSSAARAAYREVVAGEKTETPAHWQVADELQRLGIREGDEVASIGYAFDALWARLARVRIVSEITSGSLEAPRPDADIFWHAEASRQAAVLELLAQTGAKVVVANRVPPRAVTEGWRRVGETEYYVHVLDEKAHR